MPSRDGIRTGGRGGVRGEGGEPSPPASQRICPVKSIDSRAKDGSLEGRTMTDADETLEAIRCAGAVVPHGLLWLVEHELLRPYSQPQMGLGPWFLCSEPEIVRLSRRWPGLCLGLDAVPFARAIVRGDELACLVLGSSEVIVIEYEMFSREMPPPVKVLARFDHFMGWLRSLLSEVAEWIEIMSERSDA